MERKGAVRRVGRGAARLLVEEFLDRLEQVGPQGRTVGVIAVLYRDDEQAGLVAHELPVM